jgi:hypothetical protein
MLEIVPTHSAAPSAPRPSGYGYSAPAPAGIPSFPTNGAALLRGGDSGAYRLPANSPPSSEAAMPGVGPNAGAAAATAAAGAAAGLTASASARAAKKEDAMWRDGPTDDELAQAELDAHTHYQVRHAHCW